MSSSVSHLVVGLGGGVATQIITGSETAAFGFLFSSVAIDLDHVWVYWLEKKFSRMFDFKRIFEYHNKEKLEQFVKKPFLHLLPFHTVEFIFLFLLGAIFLTGIISALFWGAIVGMLFHIIMDDFALFRLKGGCFKRCHSVFEYFIRKNFFQERTYRDLYF